MTKKYDGFRVRYLYKESENTMLFLQATTIPMEAYRLLIGWIDYIGDKLPRELESHAPTHKDQSIDLHPIVATALAAGLKISTMNPG